MMRTLLAVFLAVQSLSAADIPAGTLLLLRLETPVTSQTAKAGDRLHFRTLTPLTEGDQVVAPAGSYATATVVTAKRSGRVRGRAQLDIQMERITLPAGGSISLTRTRLVPPKPPSPPQASSIRDDAWLGSAVAIGFVLGLPIIAYGNPKDRAILGSAGGGLIAFAVLKRGKEISLDAGTVMELNFDEAVPLD